MLPSKQLALWLSFSLRKRQQDDYEYRNHILFVVYPVPATGSLSPGLPVPAVERDWLMCDCD